ncbi:HAD family hydrolase [Paracoccus saliphilus]|uniref:2-haloacid dehalogenase n=1 Tax=Paracoccus saliphilus TaxID=405559 RepID=A0AA45W8K9_9RHOB|nr:HAD family phosphatase [Paracoccus saliphilus]WCR02654.1 HAD family phosphatase [Paracoccus saliphilus]SIT17513.1 2-haloacid dehalogenase [Paracoccus saliphilus]
MRHIVFDLGQVLIEWSPEPAFSGHFDDQAAIRDWMARVDFNGWNRLQDGGRPLAEGLAAARAAHGDEAAPLENYTANFPLTIAAPVPGSWEIAEALKAAGHRLFAITNWSHDNWPAALTGYPRLQTLFEDIVVSGTERLLKPEPEIYLTLTRRNDIASGDCIFIDDSAANVEGARAVGMDAIRFTDSEALRQALKERGIG